MSRNTKTFEFRLGRPGFICFLLGMAALLFVFFLLGVRMGVDLDTYPERLTSWPASVVRQLGLTSEPSSESREKPAPLPVEMKPPEADQAEAEAKAGQEVFKEEVAKAQALPEEPKVDGLRETPLTPLPASKAAGGPEVATGSATPNKGMKASERRSLEKFIIQGTAFKEPEIAEKMRAQIAALGYGAVLRKVENAKSGARFRVEIRDIETKEEAEKILARLSKQIKGLRGVIKSEGGGGN